MKHNFKHLKEEATENDWREWELLAQQMGITLPQFFTRCANFVNSYYKKSTPGSIDDFINNKGDR